MNESPPNHAVLEPLSYHQDIRAHLEEEQTRVWKWYQENIGHADYADAARLELLKAAYRLGPDAHSSQYAIAQTAARRLNLTAPITLYQWQQADTLNASLVYLPNEIHIAFAGAVFDLLSEPELMAVIGHEMAHYQLWTMADGAYWVTDRLLIDAANSADADVSQFQTARRYALYTEIFCDRGALIACDELDAVVSGLIKMTTGLREADAGSYLQQADEIFAAGEIRSEGLSHPETFIRSRAVALWHRGADEVKVDRELQQMIRGPLSLDELDLLDQCEVTALTEQLIRLTLAPEWFRTESVMAVVKLYFTKLADGVPPSEPVATTLKLGDDKLREYAAFVLLDFLAADHELGDQGLGHILAIAQTVGVVELVSTLAKKELKIPLKRIRAASRAQQPKTEAGNDDR